MSKFNQQESYKFLQESWQVATSDKKRILVIDEKSHKSNLTTTSIFTTDLKKSYQAYKQQNSEKKESTPAWA
ncbi:hypothetical protein PPL_00020 [Heterostelium album PN500]|uniref:Uncharacterized protein n=1 Tax=Heterostelium pallidum (strain ATCC 26659 / Pp 5 / PN500) TaxID=670386 RepID=D3BVL9_HETP5|nr:hypothetical protein PPL_00020 [Heterostelium album PN500]EFA74522.1 hypothetical protein PPL_00020 [Heterostelium album PN500]|eukprot:XP_020426656.1 hypothetical protein PPL_00020 [Heterostelium album PN500]